MPKTQSLLWKLNYKSQLLEWWITGFRPSNVACQAGEKNQNKTKSTWKTQEKVQMTVQKASNSPLKYERGSRPMDEELTRKRESSIEVMVHNIRKTQLPSKWQKLPLPSIGIASFLWSGNHTEISWATGQNLITNNSKNMGFLLSCSKCYLNVTFSIPVPPVMRKLYTKQTNHVKHVPCHSSLLINNTRQITAGVVAVTCFLQLSLLSLDCLSLWSGNSWGGDERSSVGWWAHYQVGSHRFAVESLDSHSHVCGTWRGRPGQLRRQRWAYLTVSVLVIPSPEN